MNKIIKLSIAAVGLGGLGYFLYKKGLFNQQSSSELNVKVINKDIKTAVEPDDSLIILAAKKAKEIADAELAKLQDESAKMKLAIEAEKARLAKLLAAVNAEAAVREAATAEAQRVRLAQLETERLAALESERVRLGRIEAQRLEDARLALIARAAAREAAVFAEVPVNPVIFTPYTSTPVAIVVNPTVGVPSNPTPVSEYVKPLPDFTFYENDPYEKIWSNNKSSVNKDLEELLYR